MTQYCLLKENARESRVFDPAVESGDPFRVVVLVAAIYFPMENDSPRYRIFHSLERNIGRGGESRKTAASFDDDSLVALL